MSDLNATATNEEDMSSPTSNDQKTAVDGTTQLATTQFDGTTQADLESKATTQLDGTTQAALESNEQSIQYGVDLAPVGNLISVVENNLAGCQYCNTKTLKLVQERRVGFASDWKLQCDGCDRSNVSHRNKVNDLKRKMSSTDDYKERRKYSKDISRRQNLVKKKEKRTAHMLTAG